MKLCFLAGANSIHSVRWISYFLEQGHGIVWISLAPPSSEANYVKERVSFYSIKPSPLADISGIKGLLFLPRTIRAVRTILKKERPDVLHVHSAGTYGLIGAYARFHPTILTPWGSDVLLSSWLKKIITRFIVKKSDFYTCDGENTLETLHKLGANPKHISVIRFGTDIHTFKPNPTRQENPSTITVLSLRNHEPVYDIKTLIHSIPIVIKENARVRFVIAGDGSRRTELEQIAHTLHLEGYVKFIGRISGTTLVHALQSSDIYVSTSLSDSGLAASTAEAMSSGLPVVVTDSGDNREWVSENLNGYIVPLGDYQALAECILLLSKNGKMRHTFGKNNRTLIEERNNYAKEMKKMESIYVNLATHKNT